MNGILNLLAYSWVVFWVLSAALSIGCSKPAAPPSPPAPAVIAGHVADAKAEYYEQRCRELEAKVAKLEAQLKGGAK